MALGNYEAAAANLHRYLNFDQRIVSLMFQQTSESTISLEKIKAIEIGFFFFFEYGKVIKNNK